MRLWTLNPSHLDAQGLVAVWREALLAKAVLQHRTRGYHHHPQLLRFRNHPRPVAAINTYLTEVLAEARRRGYRFDGRKMRGPKTKLRIRASAGQLAYEWSHLLRKLRRRSPGMYRSMRRARPTIHRMFQLTNGPVAQWEVRRP
jgi:hypothetical protein